GAGGSRLGIWLSQSGDTQPGSPCQRRGAIRTSDRAVIMDAAIPRIDPHWFASPSARGQLEQPPPRPTHTSRSPPIPRVRNRRLQREPLLWPEGLGARTGL